MSATTTRSLLVIFALAVGPGANAQTRAPVQQPV